MKQVVTVRKVVKVILSKIKGFGPRDEKTCCWNKSLRKLRNKRKAFKRLKIDQGIKRLETRQRKTE